MNKKWLFLFAGFSLIFGMILVMGMQMNQATKTIAIQPMPVQAPAPSYMPARTTPVATTAVSQPSPAPQPAPRPDSATVNNQPIASDMAGQLAGFIFIITVLFVVSAYIGLNQPKQTTYRPYASPRLVEGMQS